MASKIKLIRFTTINNWNHIYKEDAIFVIFTTQTGRNILCKFTSNEWIIMEDRGFTGICVYVSKEWCLAQVIWLDKGSFRSLKLENLVRTRKKPNLD